MSKKRQLGQYFTSNFDLVLRKLEFDSFFTKDIFCTYDTPIWFYFVLYFIWQKRK
jgi:hypothetical protein